MKKADLAFFGSILAFTRWMLKLMLLTVDLSQSTEFSAKVAEAGVITLDVRTPGEFMGGFIQGATEH